MAKASDEFADYLRDLLRPLGPIRLRRMFGGYGIYADELFFAVVVEEQLYFKVDVETRPAFEAEGLEEWVYHREGKPMHMNYFRPPEAVFDEEDELLHWGRLALAAARRAQKPKKASPPARAGGLPKSVAKKAAVKDIAVKRTAAKSTAGKKKP